MKDMFQKSWISQLSILVVCCLCLPITAVAQTASLNGTVVEEGTLTPIANVRVWACVAPCGDNDWVEGVSSQSDGSYELTGLNDGQQYKIKYFTWPVPQYVGKWYENATNYAAADFAEASNAGTSLNDVILEVNALITGKVIDVDGTPIEGVTVYAREGDEWIASTVTTAVDGNDNNYTLPGLSASRTYDIFFYADNIGYPNEWYNDQEAIDGSITVPAGATTVQGGATRVDAILGVFETSSSFNWLLFLPTIIINTTKL